jgi:hypothetical protein
MAINGPDLVKFNTDLWRQEQAWKKSDAGKKWQQDTYGNFDAYDKQSGKLTYDQEREAQGKAQAKAQAQNNGQIAPTIAQQGINFGDRNAGFFATRDKQQTGATGIASPMNPIDGQQTTRQKAADTALERQKMAMVSTKSWEGRDNKGGM